MRASSFFDKIWDNFCIFPKNRGMRQKIQSWDIKITPYPQLFRTYLWAAIHSFGDLSGKKEKKEITNRDKT